MSAAAPARKRPYRMTARADAAAATGERLLAAAWRHFASRPYDDVRVGEIAAEAGVSAQTLHNRFRSKEELFTAAFLRWGAAEGARRDTAPVGDVRGAIEVLFDRYEAHGQAVLRLLSQEERIPAVRQMTDAGRAYHRRWARRTFAPLAGGLRGAARERRLTAIAAATDLLVWKLLRREMQLPRAQAERVMAEMIEPPRGG
ncbi:MAG TPA: helix-turn-helix domain-containing protein [Solirubrobacteraceae bacterium]|nr:helix-turn-helix domain-containing protein [Solirubrobacteraceae bacterium]